MKGPLLPFELQSVEEWAYHASSRWCLHRRKFQDPRYLRVEASQLTTVDDASPFLLAGQMGTSVEMLEKFTGRPCRQPWLLGSLR